MKITLQADFSKVEKELKKTQVQMNLMVNRSLLRTAQFGTQIILDRTEKGIGVDGPFKRYSPAYAKAKAEGWSKAGTTRRAFGGDSSGIVNLTVHGEMLSSIQQRSLGSNTVEIFFGRSTEAKKAAFNQKTRKFFGFNRAEMDRLQAFFIKGLQ